jgi:hypothetical protein
MLIDLFSSDLVAGYKEIVVARQALVEKWRFDLLRAYTHKRERYAQQLALAEACKERYQSFLPLIGIFLMLGAGIGALIAVVPSMGLSRTPPPPENPVTRTSSAEDESRLRQKLFPRLVPLWRRAMARRIPTEHEAEQMAVETGRWDLPGELNLIRALERVATPETYILHSLLLNPEDDLDVVVLGPKGFWYFEVRHWDADFAWQQGAWQFWQFDPQTQASQPVTLPETPDEQWKRMRDEALTFLKANASSALKRMPVIENIQGGIVFTNPQARVEIDRSAPFRYGNIEQWVTVYQAAPRLKDISQGRTIQLLGILLKRHQSFYPDIPLRSMKDAIADVIAEVERGIQEWIDSE